ncbi:MAG: hypothetical protein KME13_18315 [Myxacorys californica WJT36-NPBG1]|nr:hypothetical protein [Myxacorys californica WJT36-NPBG1]
MLHFYLQTVSKGNERWVWLALDVVTREIVGCYVGDRSGEAAKAFWESLPPVYRQCAVGYSDFWVSYPVALPSKRHQAVGKESGKTSYIERFNNTLRQRVSRLVRKTLSFSKDLNNHIRATPCGYLRSSAGTSSITTTNNCGSFLHEISRFPLSFPKWHYLIAMSSASK